MPESNKIPEAVDVVVIGGGIVGSSTAYYLARNGISVALCEKGEIACEQSGRNWGFIRQQGRDPVELPLMIHSLALWHELVGELDEDIGFHVGGTLYLSETEQRYQSNLAWLKHAKVFNLDTHFLSLGDLQALIPGIQGQSRGALCTPSDACAEPTLATRAIAKRAKQHGATILNQCAVRGIDIEAGRVAGVVTEHGRIRAPAVVCAGGAWSSYFCRHLDLVLPQLKVTGSVMATAPAALITQLSVWRSGLGLRRRMDGGYNVAYGGSSTCDLTPDYLRFFRDFFHAYKNSKEQVSLKIGNRFFTELRWPAKWSFDQITPFEKERILNPNPDIKLLNKAYRLLGQTFPQLKGIEIKQRWAGMIDVTPDQLPVISTVDRIPGLTLSTGYSGHGFGIGLGAGNVTAKLAIGKTPAVSLDAFSMDRLMR
ncbi:NAD(P)/FAD-dependent oxidoreductase [Candidatus Spongiihabitans sp.]|uniref:NAD(P)/FAD-dependent oxidoreductase n=1 Tax=Candidatus Spongiihabitans sp. TaxID=3101308 RepID=UPI003C6FC136